MPRKTDSSNPADWLHIAILDLEGISALARHELAYTMCRSKLAEVIEKILKAELIRAGWVLVKTHDLIELGEELRVRSPDLFVEVKPLCESFAQVYFTDRYPGFDLADPDWQGFRAHVTAVELLCVRIKKRVG